MIKVLGLGILPLLAAFIYGQGASESLLPPFHEAEQADRIFLAKLESQDVDQRERAAALDRQSMTDLPTAQPIPAATLVATPRPAQAAPLPLNRSMDRSRLTSSLTISLPEGAPHSQPAPPVMRSNTPTGPVTEVRRAIPVLSHRATIVISRDEVAVYPATR